MEQSRKKSKILTIVSWSCGGLIALFLLWGGAVEPNRLVIRRSTIQIDGLSAEMEGVKAVIIADTHFGTGLIDKWRRERILKAFRSEKAELCFLLGDYIAVGSLPHYGAMSPEELTAFFAALKAPGGTFAVLGNHELWYGRKRMTDLLQKAGIQMIENKKTSVKGITLAGVPDSSTAPFEKNKFNEMIKEPDQVFLLSHKGGMLRFINRKKTTVMFSADTHGGQIRIPGVSSLKDFLQRRKEFAPGVSKWWGHTLFITTGAGGHRLGFRLFCPPEIAVVTFTGKKGNI